MKMKLILLLLNVHGFMIVQSGYSQDIFQVSTSGIEGVKAAVLSAVQTDDSEQDRLRPPVIPAWAFGHWIWEDMAHTRDAVEYLISGYRTYDIPVGVVIFDSPWSMSYNDFTWNTAAYPNPQDMIEELHRRGIKAVAFYTGAINRESNDTPQQKCDSYDFVKENGFAINQGRESSWWKGPAIHVDFTNPKAVTWWQTQLARLHSMGIDGAKIDAAHGKFGSPIETSIGSMDNREFGYHYFKQCFDYHVAKDPDFVAMTYAWSPFGLTGWPAAGHVNWVGDFRGDWQGMKDQLKNIYLSAQDGFSGVACEIGGYVSPASNKKQFIRYAQMGCFMPIMINGGAFGSLGHHLPWRHDDETLTLYRDLVLLHNDLAPYLFSTGVDAHLHRETIVRDSSFDTESHRLGPWLFVKAITSDDELTTVCLPDDSEWFDFWTDERYAAGTTIERSYRLDQYPVFVRAGAIVPIKNDSRFFSPADNGIPDAVTFVLYPGKTTRYVYHKPDGSGTTYHDMTVTYNAPAGSIEVASNTEEHVCLLVKASQAPVNVSGADVWSYAADRRLLRIEKQGKAFTVQMTQKPVQNAGETGNSH